MPLRAQQSSPTRVPPPANPAHWLLLTGIPPAMANPWLADELAAITEEWTPQELAATTRAQACWLASQQRQDPRSAEQRARVSPEELRSALRIMRSLFNWHTHPDVSLAGAILWAGLLLDLDAAAEERGEPSPLPFPPIWLSRGERDTAEQLDEVVLPAEDADDQAPTEHEDSDCQALGCGGPALPLPRPRTLAAMPQPTDPASTIPRQRPGMRAASSARAR